MVNKEKNSMIGLIPKVIRLSLAVIVSMSRLTMLITINFSYDNLATAELFVNFIRSFVPNWCQHIAEATPIRIEIDEDKFILR